MKRWQRALILAVVDAAWSAVYESPCQKTEIDEGPEPLTVVDAFNDGFVCGVSMTFAVLVFVAVCVYAWRSWPIRRAGRAS